MTKTITILGSTGSIGRQTLSVADELGLRVAALTAERNVDLMEAQCRKYRPKLAVLADEAAAEELKVRLADMNIRVLAGAEANEFIIYWLPLMQENAYNLIAFQHEAYTKSARLTITPEPDTLIRVFMAFKPLTAPVEIAPQTLEAPARTGFTAVEWGGAACR